MGEVRCISTRSHTLNLVLSVQPVRVNGFRVFHLSSRGEDVPNGATNRCNFYARERRDWGQPMKSEQEENLQKNLQRLRRKDPAMAHKVSVADRNVGGGEVGCEIVVGRRGVATVVHRGIQLASAYDPRKEGERIAAKAVESNPDLIVVVGFGLGYHVEAIRAKSAAQLIVYEPSAIRMRAALSVRPSLMILADQHLDLASEPTRLFRLIEARYAPGLKVHVDIHPPTVALAPEATREAVAQISRAKDYLDISIGTRVRDLKTWGDMTMQNAGSILKSPSFRELFGRFRNRPAVVVSAGPSLNKQLPLLAKYRDRVLVICIGQALGALRSAGIEPDLVHILESKNVAHQLTRVGTAENINLVLTNDVDVRLFDAPVRSRFIATPTADRIGRWIASTLGREGWTFGGSTVAHGAVSLAAAVGANPIMLIGQDLAYTNGQHYAEGSAYDKVKVTIGDDGYSTIDSSSRREMLGSDPSRGPTRMRVVKVQGWYGDMVSTSPSYAGFIDGYRDLSLICRQRGSEILNCTEGGAFIEALEHTPFADALAQHAVESFDAAQIITQRFDEWIPADPEVFVAAVKKVHRLLDKLDKNAETGSSRCTVAAREIMRSRSPQRQIDLLRRIGKVEKEVRSLLLSIPWIDAVVQPEIAESLANIRKGENLHATAEQAVKEAEFLFAATRTGVDRVRELIGFCEDSIAGKRWTPADPPATAEAANNEKTSSERVNVASAKSRGYPSGPAA